MRIVVVPLVLALTACGGGERAPASGSTSSTPMRPSEPSAPTPADGVAARIDVRAYPEPSGEVRFVVEHHGGPVVQLSSQVIVEREEGGRFTALPDATLSLRARCGIEAPRCQPLGAGGSFAPPPWSARAPGAQCAAPGSGRKVPAGRYRFVVTTCEGARTDGTPFTVAP